MSRSEWLSGLGAALLVIAIGAWMTISDARKREAVAAEIAAKPPREHNLAIFDAATDLLRTHYYDPRLFETSDWRRLESRWREKAARVEPKKLYVDVLFGFAREFPESHVAFAFPPGMAEDIYRTKFEAQPVEAPDRVREGLRHGPGFDAVTIRRGRDQANIVDSVVRGSPAERAGISPGWLVLNDNTDISSQHALFTGEFLELDPDASREIERTGKLTEEVRLAALTAHVEFELEDFSPPEDLRTQVLSNEVTYLRFDVFETMDVVEKTLEAIDDAGPAGIVLDLRRNPGGSLLHLQRVAGALLGDDVLLGTRRTANASEPMKSWRFTKPYRGPIVVLIGPSTGSAAEILAAAVQDQGRGKLVGRPTNGSVIPAEWFGLPDGGRMMIPVSDFVRSDDRRIEGIGVQPDIRVMPTLEDVRSSRDAALERALRELSPGTF
ncbi:MAG TPA: S41 family peptidase [Vicinamibacterales bacterium]|nr:S41 family peptidase [Vicinamibacterales bacterium]